MYVFLHFPPLWQESHVYCILLLQTLKEFYVLSYSLFSYVLPLSTHLIILLTSKHARISLIICFFFPPDSSPPSSYHFTSFYTFMIKLFERVAYTCYFNFLQSCFLLYCLFLLKEVFGLLDHVDSPMDYQSI